MTGDKRKIGASDLIGQLDQHPSTEQTDIPTESSDGPTGPIEVPPPARKDIEQERPRVLLVDDRLDILQNYARALTDNEELRELADFRFFRIADKDGGRPEDLLKWLEGQRWFTCLYMDGDLNAPFTGFDVIRTIREKPGFRYQAAAILTMHASVLEKERTRQAEEVRDVPILFKFNLPAPQQLRYLVEQGSFMHDTATLRMWRDLQDACMEKVAEGQREEELARFVGDFLRKHYGVKAWYFRRLTEKGLESIASDDAYGAGNILEPKDVPPFMKDEFDCDDREGRPPWLIKNHLERQDVGRFTDMWRDRVLMVTLGKDQTRYRTTFTIYRSEKESAFRQDDARELHHAMLPVHAVSEQIHEQNVHLGLAKTISEIMTAESSQQAADRLQEFVHNTWNQPRRLDGATKTTIRAFRRGTGDLIRITTIPALGRAETAEEWKGDKSINVSKLKNSVYVKVILSGQSNLVKDNEKEKQNCVSTTKQKMRSWVTVPLRHGSARIGALNLEAFCPNAYTEGDKEMLEALANLTAANIFRRHGERFIRAVTHLANRVLQPSSEDAANPHNVLQDAAQALYLFCGYSDLLLLEPPENREDGNIAYTPWRVVAGWEGANEKTASAMNTDRLGKWNAWLCLDEQWRKSFVRRVLVQKNEENNVFFTNKVSDIAPDHASDGPRPGRPTLSQLVVRLGPAHQPEGLLTLLFEHPAPIPEQYHEILGHFAEFMAAVYAAERKRRSLQQQLEERTLEARRAHILGQLRHTVRGELATLRSRLDRVQLALEEQTVEDARKALEQTLESLDNLSQTAERLAHATRMRKPEIRPIDPAEIWNERLETLFRERAEKLGITLHSAETGQMLVLADEFFLGDIFFNLVDNVFEHGKNVRHVHLHLRPEQGELAVTDDGDAIPEKHREGMFDSGITTSPSGGGQGLHFSREVAREMDGSLWYVREDEENRFWLRLPRAEKESGDA